MAKDDVDVEEGARSAVHFLDRVAEGALSAHLSGELHKLGKMLVNESRARGETVKGELVLRMSFAAEPTGVVGVVYETKMKEPPKKTARAHMWLTPGGNFSATNPKQPDLPGVLREVKRDAPELRDVNKPAPAAGKE